MTGQWTQAGMTVINSYIVVMISCVPLTQHTYACSHSEYQEAKAQAPQIFTSD